MSKNKIFNLFTPVKLNILHLALLSSFFTIFFIGNAIVSSQFVVIETLNIAIPCLSFILIIYIVDRLFNSIHLAVSIAYILLFFANSTIFIELIFYGLGLTGFISLSLSLKTSRKLLLPSLGAGFICTLTIQHQLIFIPKILLFDVYQRIITGNISIDHYFHSAIASMIKTYGIASTGINGLMPIPYHTFSHSIFANLSLLSNIKVIEVYGIASTLLFSPLLVFCFAASCSTINEGEEKKINPIINWIFFCIILIIYPLLFSNIAAGWNQYFTSDSYLISLGPFLLAISLLCKSKLRELDLLSLFLLLIICSASKASSGLLLLILFFIRIAFFHTKTFRMPMLLCFMISAIGVVLTILSPLTKSTSNIGFELFHFIKTYTPLLSLTSHSDWKNIYWVIATTFFIALHFSATWIYMALSFSVGSDEKVRIKIYLVTTATAIGIFVTLFLSIPGGSAYYVSNLSFFTALLFIATLISTNPIPSKIKMASLAFILILTIMNAYSAIIKRGDYLSNRPHHVNHINTLFAVGETYPKNIILDASNLGPIPLVFADKNFKCIPFIFPALSERAWVAVTELWSNCSYKDYGYSLFTFDSKNKILDAPEINGQKIQEFNFINFSSRNM